MPTTPSQPVLMGQLRLIPVTTDLPTLARTRTGRCSTAGRKRLSLAQMERNLPPALMAALQHGPREMVEEGVGVPELTGFAATGQP